MPYTRAQLIDAVLSEMLVLPAGETASAEDAAKVEERFESTFSSLRARAICDVVDGGDSPSVGGNIEDELYDQLIVILAQICGPTFGKLRSEGVIEQAERKLELITRGNRGSGRLLRTERVLRMRGPGQGAVAFNFTTGQ